MLRSILVWLLAGLFVLALRLRTATWQVQYSGLSELDERISRGERLIAVFWHGSYVPLFPLLRGRDACVFASSSFRGAVLQAMCRWFGYQCLLIPERGREEALKVMIFALRDRKVAAMAVDGPLGPWHHVKPGAIELASALGSSLVPVSVSASRVKVFDQRWDRMEIPKVFSRVAVSVGAPIRIPSALDDALEVELMEAVGEAIERCARQARVMLEDDAGGASTRT